MMRRGLTVKVTLRFDSLVFARPHVYPYTKRVALRNVG